MSIDEEDRRRIARAALAAELSKVLQRAIGTGLTAEAALIAKLIDAALLNTTTDLLLKLR